MSQVTVTLSERITVSTSSSIKLRIADQWSDVCGVWK